jgi:hypothetical protein
MLTKLLNYAKNLSIYPHHYCSATSLLVFGGAGPRVEPET